MSLHYLRTRRLPDSPGSETGLPFVDVVVPAFQAGANAITAVPLTLPAAVGAGDVSPPLVLNVAAAPPAAAIQGDCVIGCEVLGGLDVGLGMCGAQVTTAGGPGVGIITARVVNPTGAAIPAAPASRTFRVFLDR
ncbi:MAG: hypothetical protein PHX83_14580 [Acidobacteriia bacterium]|nr:hypothetical protein [Terriglobia bacterium]